MTPLESDSINLSESLIAESPTLRFSADHEKHARRDLGQVFTPPPLAKLMARLFEDTTGEVRLLDPGAGTGALSMAFIEEACCRPVRPSQIQVTAYEVDASLLSTLRTNLGAASIRARRAGVQVVVRVMHEDFLNVSCLDSICDLLSANAPSYTHAFLNPPYRKISSNSHERAALSRAGLETSNLYAGFVYLASRLLVRGGELVAITPRSFCNGPYFRPFRIALLEEMRFKTVHLFDSRDRAFRGDGVLQETLVYSMRKDSRDGPVRLRASTDPADEQIRSAVLSHGELVWPFDRERFIRFPLAADTNGSGDNEAGPPPTCSLAKLGLSVSTGRVVDFRVREHLRQRACDGSAPLVYPCHFHRGHIRWPKEDGRKPNAVMCVPDTIPQMVPAGWYVLVKRFTAKEEPRRVVATFVGPGELPGELWGFENHLNYFHGRHLDGETARGLSSYLNSACVERTIRGLNGHTQVNATDLRSLLYPSVDELRRIGRQEGDSIGAS